MHDRVCYVDIAADEEGDVAASTSVDVDALEKLYERMQAVVERLEGRGGADPTSKQLEDAAPRSHTAGSPDGIPSASLKTANTLSAGGADKSHAQSKVGGTVRSCNDEPAALAAGAAVKISGDVMTNHPPQESMGSSRPALAVDSEGQPSAPCPCADMVKSQEKGPSTFRMSPLPGRKPRTRQKVGATGVATGR